jgi:hypothetical protein
MGWKSVIASAPSFLGIKTTLAELRSARLLVRGEWKAFAALTTSTLMMSQHGLKEGPSVSSGPRALSKGIWWIACFISSSVNVHRVKSTKIMRWQVQLIPVDVLLPWRRVPHEV